MMRVGSVVDDVELPLLVVVPVPPVNHPILVPLLVSELSVVPEKKQLENKNISGLTAMTSSHQET